MPWAKGAKKLNYMSGFTWNVRGLNKSSKYSVISDWIRSQDFQFGYLLETRVKENKMKRIAQAILGDWSVVSNYEFNRLGRIWVVWGEKARLTPVFKSGQMITCSVLLKGQEEEFFCSFVYASNLAEERKNYGKPLISHSNQVVSQIMLEVESSLSRLGQGGNNHFNLLMCLLWLPSFNHSLQRTGRPQIRYLCPFPHYFDWKETKRTKVSSAKSW